MFTTAPVRRFDLCPFSQAKLPARTYLFVNNPNLDQTPTGNSVHCSGTRPTHAYMFPCKVKITGKDNFLNFVSIVFPWMRIVSSLLRVVGLAVVPFVAVESPTHVVDYG